eukprot:1313315-Amphidinium_carterae.1
MHQRNKSPQHYGCWLWLDLCRLHELMLRREQLARSLAFMQAMASATEKSDTNCSECSSHLQK